jgi:predicted ATPase
VSLDSLGNVVVIAGQNGSGKSCLFDAIRLLKSVYGGYQANEWHQWMGEFQISLTNRSSDFASMFTIQSVSCGLSAIFVWPPKSASTFRFMSVTWLRIGRAARW